MKAFIALLTLFFLTSCATQKVKRPYFWEIKKGKKTSYLLGSFHSMVDPDELPDLVFQKFDQSQQIVFEVAPQDQNNVGESFKEYLNYSDSKELVKMVHPKAWKSFVKRIEAYDRDPEVNEEYLAALTPREISNRYQKQIARWVEKTIDDALRNKRVLPNQVRYFLESSQGSQTRMDRTFAERATDQKKFTMSLDNLYEANQIINRYGLLRFNHRVAQQVELISLKSAFDRTFVHTKEGVKMVERYRRGEWPFKFYIGELNKQLKKIYQNELIDKRNQIWWPRIQKVLEEGSGNFIIVGLAHMTGPHSLLKYLSKNGFKIQRIPKPPPVVPVAPAVVK